MHGRAFAQVHGVPQPSAPWQNSSAAQSFELMQVPAAGLGVSALLLGLGTGITLGAPEGAAGAGGASTLADGSAVAGEAGASGPAGGSVVAAHAEASATSAERADRRCTPRLCHGAGPPRSALVAVAL